MGSEIHDLGPYKDTLVPRNAPTVNPLSFRSSDTGDSMFWNFDAGNPFNAATGDVTIVIDLKKIFTSFSTDYLFTDSLDTAVQGYTINSDNGPSSTIQLLVNGGAISSSVAAPLTGPLHLVISHKNNNEVKFYFNGVLVATVASSTTVTQGTGGFALGGRFFNGGDAEFNSCYYYNRVINGNEVARLYADTLAPFELADILLGVTGEVAIGNPNYYYAQL